MPYKKFKMRWKYYFSSKYYFNVCIIFRPTDPYFYPLPPVNQLIKLVSPDMEYSAQGPPIRVLSTNICIENDNFLEKCFLFFHTNPSFLTLFLMTVLHTMPCCTQFGRIKINKYQNKQISKFYLILSAWIFLLNHLYRRL